ncbi:DUF4238 domain-containing protein [Allokutzneria oryzae]|uniref:DUF4238 domain-containing protein n=1 Tax=Allokutzneria oryzae TaxID=1378989 RepID=A0ABV5ZPP7_9PSEU
MTDLVRRQHVVSKFYLNEFADDRGRIQRVELPGTHRHCMATTNASVVKDFYTLTLPDGTRSDAFERMFSTIESAASQAFRAVVQKGQWPVNGMHREAIAAWSALQHLRSEGMRNSHTQLQAQMIRMVVGISGKQALRELISQAENREVDDNELDAEWADITKPSGPDLLPRPESQLRALRNLWEPTTRQMMARRWTVVRFERKTLVTSDHPVALAVRSDYPEYMGVGLTNTEAFVVPLSRRVGLVMGKIGNHPGRELEIPGTTRLARAFLSEIVGSCRRYLYHHPLDDPLAGLELPQPHHQEVGQIDAGFIREDGLFSSLRDDSPEAEATARGLAAMRRAHGTQKGFTIRDIPWPIPHRRSNIKHR